MTGEHQLSKARACQIVGLSRSALYKARVDWSKRDAPVIAALNEIVTKRTRWGFWKCYWRLRADGHDWNFKRVHKVYCNMKLNLTRRTKKRKITRERQPMLAPNMLNDIWTLDFMRDALYDGRPFRTLNVIDEGNREALRIECGTSISGHRLTRVISELVKSMANPAPYGWTTARR